MVGLCRHLLWTEVSAAMMDAYTHLNMSVQDPIGDLERHMDNAKVARALIVETWGGDNRACIENLIARPSPRFRVALCLRPEEGEPGPEVLHQEMIAALRVRTADMRTLGPLAQMLASTGKWLLPHAESGIRELVTELLPLAARHIGLRIFLPHLGWPRQNRQDDESWRESISRLGALPNVAVGISAIAHFSQVPFPHEDVEPFATHLAEVFGPESLAVGSDYPLCEKSRYAEYMKLAEDWIHGYGASGVSLESSFFGKLDESRKTTENSTQTT